MKLWKTRVAGTGLAACAIALALSAPGFAMRSASDGGGTASTQASALLPSLDNNVYAQNDRVHFGRLDQVAGTRLYGLDTNPEAAVRPDDRGGYRGVDTPPIVVAESGSFSWNDAGIGALSVLAAVLLACMTTFALRHRRQIAIS